MMTKNKNISQGYKDSPMGIIPKEWEVKRLGDICQISVGKDLRELNYFEEKNSQYKFPVYSNTVENYGLYGYYDFEEYTGHSVTVIGREVGLGVSFSRENGYGAIGRLLVLHPNDKHNYKFLSEYINGQLNILVESAAIPQLTGEQFATYKILSPPLPEQQKIAEILSVWDEAIDVQTRLIASLQTRKRGLMQQLLTGKKRVKGFSGKWEEKPLEEMVSFCNGRAHENNIVENGEYILVNSKFISTEGTIIKRTNSCLSPLFKEDIVMVMSDVPNGRAIAKCYYIEEDNKYTLNQRICVLRTKKGYNSKFMFYVINRNKYYLLYDDGVKQTNLRKEEVLDCPIYTPEYKEQTAIANILSTADTEIDLAKKKLAKLKEQKKGLMQVLLTGKKRVKIKKLK